MQTKRKTMIYPIVLAVAITLSTAFKSSGADSDGRTLWGTWYVTLDAAAGLSIPAVVTVHRDGTMTASDGSDFGGLPFPVQSTPLRGAWVRTGANTFKADALWFSGDPVTGELLHITGGRISFGFADDFDHLSGAIVQEVFQCPTPFTCPDPLTAEPDITLPAVTFRGTRLRVER